MTVGLPFGLLTPRERQVLEMLTSGRTSKEIGRDLGISHRTVQTHRERIMLKFGARNAADLVRKSFTAGRID